MRSIAGWRARSACVRRARNPVAPLPLVHRHRRAPGRGASGDLAAPAPRRGRGRGLQGQGTGLRRLRLGPRPRRGPGFGRAGGQLLHPALLPHRARRARAPGHGLLIRDLPAHRGVPARPGRRPGADRRTAGAQGRSRPGGAAWGRDLAGLPCRTRTGSADPGGGVGFRRALPAQGAAHAGPPDIARRGASGGKVRPGLRAGHAALRLVHVQERAGCLGRRGGGGRLAPLGGPPPARGVVRSRRPARGHLLGRPAAHALRPHVPGGVRGPALRRHPDALRPARRGGARVLAAPAPSPGAFLEVFERHDQRGVARPATGAGT